MKNSLNDKKANEAKKILASRGEKHIHIDKVETSDLKNRNIPVHIDAQVSLDHQVSPFGNERYIGWDFFKVYEPAFVTDSSRLSDYIFSHKLHRISEISVKVPANWELSSLPKSYLYETEDFYFSLEFNHDKAQNIIFINEEITIPNGRVRLQFCDHWAGSLQARNKLYSEFFVFKVHE